jgi:hypothetical protein
MQAVSGDLDRLDLQTRCCSVGVLLEKKMVKDDTTRKKVVNDPFTVSGADNGQDFLKGLGANPSSPGNA